MDLEKAKKVCKAIPKWSVIDCYGANEYEEVAKALAVMYTYSTMLEKQLEEINK